jgi:5-methylcytosine-specific restriction protein A
MPSRPNTPCRHPGCAALVPYGTKYCEVHKPLHPEEVRSAGARGYGRAWQKARKRYLEAHPFCVECLKEGKYVKATDVDHIVPHRGDKTLFWDEATGRRSATGTTAARREGKTTTLPITTKRRAACRRTKK